MTAPKKVLGIGWRHYDSADEHDDLEAAAERARHFERVRIATWLRTKARLGLAEEWTNKDVLYALLAYADAIDANRIDL